MTPGSHPSRRGPPPAGWRSPRPVTGGSPAAAAGRGGVGGGGVPSARRQLLRARRACCKRPACSATAQSPPRPARARAHLRPSPTLNAAPISSASIAPEPSASIRSKHSISCAFCSSVSRGRSACRGRARRGTAARTAWDALAGRAPRRRPPMRAPHLAALAQPQRDADGEDGVELGYGLAERLHALLGHRHGLGARRRRRRRRRRHGRRGGRGGRGGRSARRPQAAAAAAAAGAQPGGRGLHSRQRQGRPRDAMGLAVVRRDRGRGHRRAATAASYTNRGLGGLYRTWVVPRSL
jgi:hypothetical protein